MTRKWTALAVVGLTVLAAAGFSIADDGDETPLGQVMEKVQKNNATVLRGVRNAAMYKKAQEDVVESATQLVKLGKEFRKMGEEPSKALGKEVAEWEKLTDLYVKEAENFSALLAKPETTQSQAKDAYKVVSKTCTNCHEVFRVEDEGF